MSSHALCYATMAMLVILQACHQSISSVTVDMADQEDQDVAVRQAEPKRPAIMGISVLAAMVVLLVGALVEIGITQVCLLADSRMVAKSF